MAPGPGEDAAQGRRLRILFFAEAVTLAHVARPAALAAALDASRYEVHLAQHPRYRELLGNLPCREHDIESIPPAQFAAALARGAPVYDSATLVRYVEAERELLERVAPDMVVGDFRISLPVSAELAGIPCVTLGNACWSPYTRQRYVVPDLPLTRLLGPALAQPLFALARPLAFTLHSLPMRAVRRRFGLRPLGFDLNRVYTHGDFTLYADLPELYVTRPLPAHHRFIGPIVWSPAGPPPSWWDALPGDRPLLYVTPGSSGRPDLLPRLLAALGELPVTAMVAAAGDPGVAEVPDNCYLAPFLPGAAAARRADLVICNGGSPTTQQALAGGTPVLGIAGNLDQFLNMQTVSAAGAGLGLRADNWTGPALRDALSRLLTEGSFTERARGLQGRIAACDGVENFVDFLRDAFTLHARSLAGR